MGAAVEQQEREPLLNPVLVGGAEDSKPAEPAKSCPVKRCPAYKLPSLFLVAMLLAMLGGLCTLRALINTGALDTVPMLVSGDVEGLLGLLSPNSATSQVLHVSGGNHTAQEALAHLVPSVSALLLVTLGPSRPQRRDEDTPFLSLGQGVPLPADVINAGAGALEAALGRRLPPLRIEAADFETHVAWTRGLDGRLRPVAVWEAGSGLVLVDTRVVGKLWAGEPKVPHMAGLMGERLFRQLAASVTQAGASVASLKASGAVASAQELLGPALAAAVAGAFAAAPPLWFCIVCPAVLGLLAPLLINLALNQLAGFLCTRLSLTDDQCFDVLLGALGLSFVLALASAIPIFYACQLGECSHRGGDSPPSAAMTASAATSSAGAAKGRLRRRWF